MKDKLKKVYKVIEIIFALIFVGLFIFNIIDKTVISRNSMRIFALCFVVIHLLAIFTKNSKGDYLTLIIFAISVATLLLSLSSLSVPKKDYYELDSQIGTLRHDIYKQSKVNVYYNVDVADEEDVAITYLDDYKVSDEEALKAFKKIKEVLAKYSKGLPSSIYLINDFAVKGENEDAIYLVKGNYIILKNQEDLEYALHHEIAHSIENKSYDLISFIKFRSVKKSCESVSLRACVNNDELFAETLAQYICNSNENKYSQALEPLINKYLSE